MSNIYDVAREAGVSRSTVSRVLNNRSEVNEETRLKVLDAIQKLNYQPNATARSLALSKSNTIGVITKHIANTFYAEFIESIHVTAEKAGYGTLFSFCNTEFKSGIDYTGILNGKVDGIIFVGENTFSDAQLQVLAKNGIPTVVIESKDVGASAISVNINNFEAAYNATSYLIMLGHRKIAHIYGNKDMYEFSERIEGYKAALKKNGITVDERIMQDGNFRAADSMKRAEKLFNSQPDITAAFCANDIMAAGVIQAAISMGKRIPEDFSVIGFDDMIIPELIPFNLPSITTVRQPKKEMAEYAVGAVVDWIENGTKGQNKVFDTDFIIRNSTGPKTQ